MANASPHTQGPVDVGELIDDSRWGPYQKYLVGLTALAIIFDGIDNQLLGVAIPTIMAEWSAPRAAFAPVVALGYFGMMIGGAAAGLAGDRFGRRTALMVTIAIFGAMTLAAAYVNDTTSLGWVRFLAGIGLGGAVPNAATLAAEYVPKHRRPLAVTVTIVCMPLGATIAGILGANLLSSMGWRTLFIVGGAVPLVAAALLARALPESPRYLTRHRERWPELVHLLRRMGHAVPAGAAFTDSAERATQRAPLTVLFQPEFRGDTLALWGSFFSCLLAVYLGFSWLPSLLSGAGFGPGVASTGITAFNLGGVVGAVAGGMAISVYGSRVAMLTMAAGAVAGAIGLSLIPINASTSILLIMIVLTWTGGLINAVQTTMFALAANVYPSQIRATGVGTAVSVGRLGAILSGYAGAWALEYRGSLSYFGLMAAAMAVCFLALAAVRHHVPARH